MQNADSKLMFTNRGIEFGNAPQLEPAELIWHAAGFAKTRRRTSIYLADCIIELSDNYLLYKESLVHKRDLATELQIAANTECYPDVLTLEQEFTFAKLGQQLPQMTPEQIAASVAGCQVISAKYLSNLLEVKTQWIYNARSIMRRYPITTRPHDPHGVLGVSHYQDVTRPNLSAWDSLYLLQEYLDAKAR